MSNVTSHRSEGFFLGLLSGILGDESLKAEIVEWYLGVFNAKGPEEWNENWTTEQVYSKLFVETTPDADRSHVITWRKDGKLAGFAMTVVVSAEEFMLQDLPPHMKSEEVLADMRKHLAWTIGQPGGKMVFFREIGILPEYRKGMGPVLRLCADPTEAGMHMGAVFSGCWTSRQKKMYPILDRVDCITSYEFGDANDNVVIGGHLPYALNRLRADPATIMAMFTSKRKRR